MAWFITGASETLTLAVSDAGVPTCHGQDNVHHEFYPIGLDDPDGIIKIDRELLLRLQRAQCSWSIHLPNDSDFHIDPNGEGLLNRVRQAPTQSHGMIKFFSDTPHLVSFRMVSPESTFVHIRRLLELVLRSDYLEYGFRVDFGIFRQAQHAKTGTPMFEEFMDGRPAFFDEFSISARARKSKT